MIYDHYWEKWNKPQPQPAAPVFVPVPVPAITPEEIAEFRRLLGRAREYDRKMNQPECELEEKREKLRKLAEELGLSISFD
jgi:hypothetical protein